MTRSPTPLVIIGAGGLGRETLAATRAAAGIWSVQGFADDGADLTGTTVDGVPVLGPVASINDTAPGAAAVIATGRPGNTASRTVISQRLRDAGVPCAS